jgi:salicylate hydroxylase
MAPTTSPKVIIVGCGIAGPAIALLLQKKGYTPVILEKVRQLGDAGASLMMQPNGYVYSQVQKYI